MYLKLPIFVLLGTLMLASELKAQSTVTLGDSQDIDAEKLSKVKAAFLLNFIKFTTWPENRFESATAPLQLVIVGEDDIGNVLDATLRGRDWHGHPIQIVRVPKNTRIDPSANHVVYVARSSNLNAENLKSMNQAGILTVGFSRDIAKIGAILGFSIDDGKVNFTFNASAIKESPLQISSRLLSLGKAVD